VTIKLQKPKTVPLEVAFEGHYPKTEIQLGKVVDDELSFEFEGIGFVVDGAATAGEGVEHTLEVEMYIDGKLVETATLPTNFTRRRFYPFWQYQLPMAKHTVHLKVLNPTDKAELRLNYVVTYADEPARSTF
jgi:hypothetical protein